MPEAIVPAGDTNLYCSQIQSSVDWLGDLGLVMGTLKSGANLPSTASKLPAKLPLVAVICPVMVALVAVKAPAVVTRNGAEDGVAFPA